MSLAAGLVTSPPLIPTASAAEQDTAPLPETGKDQQILLKGGVVLSQDPAMGDFDKADVLIRGDSIEQIAPDIRADGVQLINAENMIILPGFIDSHRHIWQGQLRNILPDGRLSDYLRDILLNMRAHYRPEDAWIGNHISALAALNAGVTTLLDWSHINNTPEHTDAAIAGLQASGMRAVYAYGGGVNGPDNKFPADIHRLRKHYFSSADQLLTLAMAAGNDAAQWAVAREVDAPISSHVNTTGTLLPLADFMGPDNSYIHCPNLLEEEFRLIADTGGGVSISGPVEMEMGHGVPPYQQVIDHNIPWSFSNDVETAIPAEFFTQMRTAFTLQRMFVFALERDGVQELPDLLSTKKVVEIATMGGARVNHLDHKTGSLTPGKQADIIMLDMKRINVMPVNNAYGAIVLGMDTANVKHVFVAGRIRKWNGQLVDTDLEILHTRARQSREYILDRAGWQTTISGAVMPSG